MTTPTLELVPLKNGVPFGRNVAAEILVRITPPEPAALENERPRLNLALVIDRSGSMAGRRLQYARQAAAFAVAQLSADDRVSVVVYDSEVEVIVPSTPVTDKAGIIARIEKITAGGTTALHAGWLAGATQAANHASGDALNRVILLSDGQANRGVVDPDEIASDVRGLTQHGITTSTIGVGRNFNENLLHLASQGGEGNYHFIEDPADLPAIFETELQGLNATLGRGVRLKISGRDGVSYTQILNDLPTGDDGITLPDLVGGLPLSVAALVQLPSVRGNDERVVNARLSWTDRQTGEARELTAELRLPVVPPAEFRELPVNEETQAYFADMHSTRRQQDALRSLERGDRLAAMQHLGQSRVILGQVPRSRRTNAANEELDHLEQAVIAGDAALARKRLHSQVYRKSRSNDAAALAEREARRPGGTAPAGRLEIVTGSLIEENVDAIVNPTNTGLYGKGGLDGAVHSAGGPLLTRACREIGHCAPGAAVFTDGFDLPARFVIHTVGPVWRGGGHGEERQLAESYRNSLQLAQKLGARTVSVPAISTGTNGYPAAEAARVALTEITDFLDRAPGLRVRLVLKDAGMAAVFADELRNVRVVRRHEARRRTSR